MVAARKSTQQPADFKDQLARAGLNALVKGMRGGTPQQPRGRPRRRQNPASRNANMKSLPRGSRKKQEMYQAGAIRPMAFAPRGQGYYDAFATTPDQSAVAMSCGPATPIEGYAYTVINGRSGLVNETLSYPTGHGPGGQFALEGGVNLTGGLFSDNSTLVILNCGSSDNVVGKIFQLEHGTGLAHDPTGIKVVIRDITVPQFSELGPTRTHTRPYPTGTGTAGAAHPGQTNADEVDGAWDSTQGAGGRVESIPLRLSVRIKNITETIATGGEVRFLRYNGGLNTGSEDTAGGIGHIDTDHMSVTTYLDIANMMRSTKRSVPLGGKELVHPHQVNTYPADNIRSATFKDDTSFFEAVLEPKFCSCIFLIENFVASGSGGAQGIGNTYTLSTTVHRAGRFIPGSIHYSKQLTFPPRPDVIAQHAAIESVKPPTHVRNAAASIAEDPFVRSMAGAAMKTLGRGMWNRYIANTAGRALKGSTLLQAGEMIGAEGLVGGISDLALLGL